MTCEAPYSSSRCSSSQVSDRTLFAKGAARLQIVYKFLTVAVYCCLQGSWRARMMEATAWHTQPCLLFSTAEPLYRVPCLPLAQIQGPKDLEGCGLSQAHMCMMCCHMLERSLLNDICKIHALTSAGMLARSRVSQMFFLCVHAVVPELAFGSGCGDGWGCGLLAPQAGVLC